MGHLSRLASSLPSCSGHLLEQDRRLDQLHTRTEKALLRCRYPLHRLARVGGSLGGLAFCPRDERISSAGVKRVKHGVKNRLLDLAKIA